MDEKSRATFARHESLKQTLSILRRLDNLRVRLSLSLSSPIYQSTLDRSNALFIACFYLDERK